MNYLSVNLAILAAGGHASLKTDLATVKTWASLIETAITGLAVLVGGIWAYFKFARGRTFRPRIEIEMSGQWLKASRKQQFLQARIRVKNIGASKISLKQEGTGLRVSVLTKVQPAAPRTAAWSSRGFFSILQAHEWIEPGETISDDLLINLTGGPVAVLFESYLVVANKILRKDIETSAREVFAADAVISERQR